jgi:glycosyltransferase involved in cell wall biosynthesis
MKIGIYDPYLDDLGGGEKYMMSIAEYFSGNNEVSVFWDRQSDLKKVADRFSLNLSKITLKNNIFSSKYPFLKRCLETFNYDVLIILSDGSIPLVFSRKLFIHFQQPFPSAKITFKDNLKKMRVNSFFCNSLYTKSFIDKEFKIDSKVLYPPIDISSQKKEKRNIILHVGRYRSTDDKGQDYKKQGLMIDIFKKMIDQGLKDWKFILAVGLKESDEYRFDKLRKKAQDYPIEFLVNLNNKDLEKKYSESKIYWHASGYGEDLEKKPELAEHFGISTVEAMMAGAVPVVINAGGQREIVEDGKNGYLWNALDDFIMKTNNLIEDKKNWEKMSINAMTKSKVFAKNRFHNDLEKLIK